MKITTSENELIELLPEGSGNFYADGAYDSKKVLNTVVEKIIGRLLRRLRTLQVVLAVRRETVCFLKKSMGIGILMRGSGVRLQRGLAVGSPVF
ncbi:hypothetical protein OCC_14170 [Thermococcus litoralis DSM 5473]|uniref:Uncharacterized protein n=1 Tax=Thermococcus litoralis (strain ATCC 51850 / DSM 5473 / JCM 8560 / NS-C) TaxID=523849 RepID=S5Z4X3_THELN|nr:hypothetical protein [Thermococcus litoralis]AGT34315.1 hypothetical protein OCC_14170 [Thermococcus litoralis DSM 5473]